MRKTLSEAWLQMKMGLKVLRLVFESSPKFASLYFVTQAVSSSLPAVSFYAAKLTIDAILTAIKSPTHQNIQLVVLFIVINFLVDGLMAAFGSLSNYGYDACKDVFNKLAIGKVLDKAATLDLEFFENPKFFDQLEKVQRDIYWRPVQLMSVTVETFSSMLGLASLLVILVRLSPWVPLVIIILNLPRLLFRLKFSYWTFSITNSRSPEHRKINQVIWLLTQTHSAKEVKIFSLKEYLLNIFNHINDEFIVQNRKLAKKQNIFVFLLELIANGGYYGIGFFAAMRAIFQQISIGDLTMYTGTVRQFQMVLHGVVSNAALFYENNLFLQNYFSFLDYQPKIINKSQTVNIDTSTPLHIEFKNVDFSYSDGKKILSNINLVISDARNFALVGENGAGKTTLVKLLLRLYDVGSGQILINGVDIREIELENLRANIGVIFQDFAKYDLSVRENIGFGDVKNINNIGRIRKAARLSGAAEFIEKFPEKYKSMLGKFWEKGEELSGGQWQKMALARAFFKESKVLIMDEPTSALDPKSEYEVFKNLISHTKNKSLILISHRFSTVRLADEIVVLHHGELIEQGTHEQLMKQNGHYAKLYNLQAKWYK